MLIREKTFLKPAALWAAWLLVTAGIARESVGQSLQVTPLGQWPESLRMAPGQVAVSGDYASKRGLYSLKTSCDSIEASASVGHSSIGHSSTSHLGKS